jgi:colanic acid/amylovoran biosynthesis glycosyltransferase
VKIGLFHSSLPGYSETFILSKIRGLIREGYDVQLFLANESHEKTDFPYVNPFPRRGLKFIFLSPWALIFIFLTRASVVRTFWKHEQHDGKSFLTCLKSVYVNAHVLRARDLQWLHFTFSTFALDREHVAAAIGARMAVSFRGFDMGIYALKHPGRFLRVWSTVDKVHTISDDLYQLALNHGLSPDVPFQKIMPAILTDKLRPRTNESEHEIKSIVTVGRLEWKKGFRYAFEAMRLLKQQGIRFMYTIIGTGSMEEELRYAIHDMQLQDCVRLAGKVPHDRIFDLLHSADVYIQPSVQEGFCNALLEAQGTGLLCITTDAEGLRENVLHGATGWIVPKRDSVALANRIEEVLVLPTSEKRKIREAAKLRVENEFRIERLVGEFVQFYSLS